MFMSTTTKEMVKVHPATVQVLRFFKFDHLAPGPGRDMANRFALFTELLAEDLPPDPETTVALRKLLEAKDAAVRAALIGEGVIK